MCTEPLVRPRLSEAESWRACWRQTVVLTAKQESVGDEMKYSKSLRVEVCIPRLSTPLGCGGLCCGEERGRHAATCGGIVVALPVLNTMTESRLLHQNQPHSSGVATAYLPIHELLKSMDGSRTLSCLTPFAGDMLASG